MAWPLSWIFHFEKKLFFMRETLLHWSNSKMNKVSEGFIGSKLFMTQMYLNLVSKLNKNEWGSLVLVSVLSAQIRYITLIQGKQSKSALHLAY